MVDEAGNIDAPRPAVSGELPLGAQNTSPIVSPQWCVFTNPNWEETNGKRKAEV